MNDETGQLYGWLDRLKRHPFFALMVFIGTVVIALATFTDSIKQLTDLTKALSPEQARVKLVEMAVPFDSTSFVEAAAKGDLATVKLFLTAGMDPNSVAEHGDFAEWTALMVSSGHNHLPVVEALLDAHANVNKSRALAYAADNEKLINLLLAHGADTDAISEAFSNAACSADIKRMERLWPSLKTPTQQASEALVAATDCLPSIPVSDETDRKKQVAVDFLLQHGADPNFQEQGWAALHKAALNGMSLVVKSLLAAGADVNQRCECSGWQEGGFTPLALTLDHYRSEYEGLKQIFYFLIERGADVNAASNAGRTVLMWAIADGDEDMVARLIDKGADVNAKLRESLDQVRVAGTTPLMFAMDRGGTKKTVQHLLDKGADVNAADENSWTPLMWAAWSDYSDPEYINLLLEHGAQINAKNNDGRTPFMLAATNGRRDIVTTLLEHGAELKAHDAMGKTAKNLAEENLEGERKARILYLLSEAETKKGARKPGKSLRKAP